MNAKNVPLRRQLQERIDFCIYKISHKMSKKTTHHLVHLNWCMVEKAETINVPVVVYLCENIFLLQQKEQSAPPPQKNPNTHTHYSQSMSCGASPTTANGL
jgi:hypothetical protein